jgi:peptidyl-prolyl cis-trans isomerase B (cyclophilin B)
MITAVLLLAAAEDAQPAAGVRLALEPLREQVQALDPLELRITVSNDGGDAVEIPPLEIEKRAVSLDVRVEGAMGGTDTVSFTWTRVVPDPLTARRLPPGQRTLLAGSSASAVLRVPATLWGTWKVKARLGEGAEARESDETTVRVAAPDGAQGLEMVLDTSRGEMVCSLDARNAPRVVTHLVSLAQAGFYDGLTFHAVVPENWIQTGDPFDLGAGGPGYAVERDRPAGEPQEFRRGTVGMAAYVDENHCGSQFFICVRSLQAFRGKYLAVGTLTQGEGTLDAIAAVETDPETFRPKEAITLRSVRIRIARGSQAPNQEGGE